MNWSRDTSLRLLGVNRRHVCLRSGINQRFPGVVAGWRIAMAVTVLLTVCMPPNGAIATDWGVSGYGYRKEITISHTNVGSTLTNFPLLVKFTADAGIGGHARSDGYDLRFTNAAGTSLSYEREAFRVSGGSGSGLFWVKVPSISSSADTTIYAYYGKSDATDGQDAANVWDANFAGVWHLPNGETLGALDSTSNNNDGTNHGAAAAACMVDGGASFNGSNSPHDYIDVGTSDGSLDITGDDLTISAWANWDGTDLHGWIISKMHSNFSTGSWGPYIRYGHPNIGMNNMLECANAPNEGACIAGGCTPNYNPAYCSDNPGPGCSVYGEEGPCNGAPEGCAWIPTEYTSCSGGQYEGGWHDVGAGNIEFSASEWHHVVIVYNGVNVTYYVDGVACTPVAQTGNIVSKPSTAKIGWEDGWNSQWFGGSLDEIRVSNIARSADWNIFEYYNQSGTNEISWGSEDINRLAILLVNTEAFQTIDDTDTASDVSLKFGETLNKSLSYNRTLGSFQFDDDLAVTGNVQTSGNLAASGGLVTDGNAVIHGTLSGSVITSATFQNICLDATANAITNIGTGSLALHTAQIRIPMKDATVEADGTNNAANVFIGSEAGVNAHQYYAIKTGESTQQDLTLKMKVRVPRDFVDFGAGNDLSFWYKNTGASTSDSKSDILVEDKDGDDAFTAAEGQGLYNAAWTEFTNEFDGGSFNPAADEFLYVTVKSYARYDSGYLSPFVGEIVLTYRAR